MPNEDVDLAAGSGNSGVAPGAASSNETLPAEHIRKGNDARSTSASGSNESDTPPPAHGVKNNDDDPDDENDEELLERMRGDAVGETMYSRRFILQTLMKLSQQEAIETLGQELEDELCKVWDMSVSPEVVTLLLENDAIELLMYAISGSDDMRLYEILIGLLGNMCAQAQCVEQLTANAEWIETLLKLATCMDTCMLIQLMRVYQYIMVHVTSGKEQFAIDWYVCFAAFDGSARNLGFILQQSVSDDLLTAALKAINAVLASCALIEEENANSTVKLKPFAEVFLVQELCDGVNSSFLRLMRDDKAKLADDVVAEDDGQAVEQDEDEEDADVGYESCSPKITCDVEIIQTYLNICTILVQLPEAQASMDVYAPSIVSCLTRILEFLLQPQQLLPLGERQEEYLEDLAHICSRLNYFYQKEAFKNLLEVWSRLRQHIENYTEGDADNNDFEGEEDEDDSPKEQYVENSSKLLRLLACMLVKAKNTEDIQNLHDIDANKIKLFISALMAEQDVLFSKAHERLSDALEKKSGQA
ncbi:GL20076 [Drosophila persimilis]|uniref:GL20076 n=1 Tax=Drosophila persimilis TaxID=7234 RepID=B4H8F0_DROPE|nr:protein saal1 [Drosophila persimilis]EDW34985.1 GL20076 [Drosophila persimilis]